jgi:hypothetical protein
MSWLGIGIQGAKIAYDQLTTGQQHNRQKELMEIQQKNNQKNMMLQAGQQRGLNRQGHELQMDMWNKTNYKAQMKHIKDAGLNAGLLYGGSGAGGTTTGSQGGGSAAMAGAGLGSAPNAPELKMMGLEAKMMEAQIANINADTKKKGGESELIGTQQAIAEIEKLNLDDKIKAEIENTLANTNNTNKDANLKDIAIKLKENGMHNDLIATVIGTVTGWDLTDKNALDQEIKVIPQGLTNMLNDVGLKVDGKITRRSVMNAAIGAWIAGKIVLNKLDKILSLIPRKKAGY